MTTKTLEPPTYRFRIGSVDHIMRSRNLTTDEQLAVFIGVPVDYINKFRAGAPVSARLALKVAALQGDPDYIAGYFDMVNDPLTQTA